MFPLQHRQQQQREEQQRQMEEELRRQRIKRDEEASVASRTRGAVVQERAKQMQPPAHVPSRSTAVGKRQREESPVEVVEAVAERQGDEEVHATDTVSGQASVTTGQEEGSEKAVRPKLPSMHSFHGPVHVGGEPAASGVQPSNITSAIRSQMISSTAAGPGAKAATNKEIYSLKRKILEKSTGPSSYHAGSATVAGVAGTMDVENTMTTGPAPKRIKTRSQQQQQQRPTQATRKEDCAQKPATAAADEVGDAPPAPPRTRRTKLCKVIKADKDPKPGYCENCREKFDDFDDVSSISHPFFFSPDMSANR